MLYFAFHHRLFSCMKICSAFFFLLLSSNIWAESPVSCDDSSSSWILGKTSNDVLEREWTRISIEPGRGAVRSLAIGLHHQKRKSLAPGERLAGRFVVAYALSKIGAWSKSKILWESIVRSKELDIDDSFDVSLIEHSLACLLKIEGEIPSSEFKIDPKQLLSLQGKISKSIAIQLLYHWAKDQPDRYSSAVSIAAVWDPRSELFESRVIQALSAVESKKFQQAEKILQSLTQTENWPKRYEFLHDKLTILLGRMQFTQKKYDIARETYQRVSRKSNELVTAMTELAWASVREGNYKEAIGVAFGLETGVLKRTFAPEAPMVLAIALNEICQFPSALRASHLFRKGYESTFAYLDGPQPHSYYQEALLFLKKKNRVPEKIGGEWIRNREFISRQDEINRWNALSKVWPGLHQVADNEEQRLFHEIMLKISEFKPKYIAYREQKMPGDSLPVALRQEWVNIKKEVDLLFALLDVTPWLQEIEKSSSRESIPRVAQLKSETETFLRARTQLMKDHLNEVAENLSLVEIEIFNEAPKDLLWENVHPQFKQYAKKMATTKTAEQATSMYWGKVELEASREVWEDEVGGFSAEVVDRCEAKDRYEEDLRKPASLPKISKSS